MTIEQPQAPADGHIGLWKEFFSNMLRIVKAGWKPYLIMSAFVFFFSIFFSTLIFPNDEAINALKNINEICETASDRDACEDSQINDELMSKFPPSFAFVDTIGTLVWGEDAFSDIMIPLAWLFFVLLPVGLVFLVALYWFNLACLQRIFKNAPAHSLTGFIVYSIKLVAIIIRPILWNVIPIYGQYRWVRAMIGAWLVQPLALLRQSNTFAKSKKMTEGYLLSIFLFGLILGLVSGLIKLPIDLTRGESMLGLIASGIVSALLTVFGMMGPSAILITFIKRNKPISEKPTFLEEVPSTQSNVGRINP